MKIGIFYDHPKNYTGGFNYITNFIFCLLNQSNKFTVYLFCNEYHHNIFQKKIINENCKIVKISVLNRKSIFFYFHKFFEKFFRSFFFFDYYAKKYQLDLISHSYYYGSVNFVHWLPDLQFLYFPKNFPKKKEVYINKTVQIYEKAKKIMVSSNESKNDLCKILPDKKNIDEKILIHKFPVKIHIKTEQDLKEVKNYLEKIKLNQYQYYFVANQFWEHKKHEFLFEVFKKLNLNNKNHFQLVCTGSLKDNRGLKTDYLKKYENEIKNRSIIILGQIQYKLVQGLIYFSKAYINPSNFEGWNTGVEEAKMMKKDIYLSNISIHKEQCENYNKSYFFDNLSEDELLGIVNKNYNIKVKSENIKDIINENHIYFQNTSKDLQNKYLLLKKEKS